MTMSIDIEKLRALLAAATPGLRYANRNEEDVSDAGSYGENWKVSPKHWTVSPKQDETGWCTDNGMPGYGISEADARLYAEAINALPALLDELEYLRSGIGPD